jgi:glutamyl-tRNA synthetase
MKALIGHFSLERVHKAGAKFNFEKAVWFNQQYVRHLSNEELVHACYIELIKLNSNLDQPFISKYVELFRDRIDFKYELVKVGSYLYSDIEQYDLDTLKKKWKPNAENFMINFIELLASDSLSSANEIEIETKKLIAQHQLGMGNILPVLRILLTGTMKGPSIFESILLLGKDKSMERIKKLNYLLNS